MPVGRSRTEQQQAIPNRFLEPKQCCRGISHKHQPPSVIASTRAHVISFMPPDANSSQLGPLFLEPLSLCSARDSFHTRSHPD